MLRIVEERAANNQTILRLDGRLVSQWIEILRASCEQAIKDNGSLILEMSGVSFADHEGLRLLRQLNEQQVALVHCSPFLREQLKSSSDGTPPTERPE
jgi:ABC-type transporter Mla MlaB component